jgi:hypothetical protein
MHNITRILARCKAYRALPAIACVVSALLAAPANALVKFDFEQRYFNEPGQAVLDHCVVEQNGVYHLFYLRGNPAINIGHATTTDFMHWKLEAPILEPGTWDNRALWAPHVIRDPSGDWYLYYTGVNSAYAQQTGIAFTEDLVTWLKFPRPRYHPDPAWALWAEDEWSHGRDPHVMEYNGKYYMFVTAKTLAGYGAVACAESNDLIHWTDIGPIFVNDTWHVLESVFIMQRNGKFHMFFTEETVDGTSHMTSNTFPTGWDISTRRIIDNGHAAQVTVLPDGTEMFSRHAIYNNYYGVSVYNLRFDKLVWVGDIPAASKPWALADDWTLVSGNAFGYQPTFWNNPAARGDMIATNHEGNCWLGTYERYTGPMGFGYPGAYQGDSRTGILRSRQFTITGSSINLLVGGGQDINNLYVALVNAETGQVLCKETGKQTDAMDRRYWDVRPYRLENVYIQIADLSTAAFGHINCDDIVESADVVGEGGNQSSEGTGRNDKSISGVQTTDENRGASTAFARLRQNSPNPFNPTTTISYDLPHRGHVVIEIFDVNGAMLRRLFDGIQPTGSYRATWNGQDSSGNALVSGVYFCRLTFEGAVVDTRKMILLK